MNMTMLLEQMIREGTFEGLARNPLIQFGTASRSYLGATLLPERSVPENMYTEDQIRYRTFLANSNSRYSPPTMKSGSLIGGFDVKLAEQDIASEFTSREYDTLLKMLRNGASLDAMASVTNWLTRTVVLPLVELNEKHRWDAIVDASVVAVGPDYSETISYPNPSGHRAAAGGDWTSNSYDPYDDIYAMVDLLSGKGFKVSRIITSRPVATKLLKNENVIKRYGGQVTLSVGGTISPVYGRLSLTALNAINAADGLPPFELYDETYKTQTSYGYFLKRDVMVFVCETGQEEAVQVPDSDDEILPHTLGYFAIGRPAGQADAGRVIHAEAFSNKPPRIEAQAWQTSLPVIVEPEAIAVITGI